MGWGYKFQMVVMDDDSRRLLEKGSAEKWDWWELVTYS